MGIIVSAGSFVPAPEGAWQAVLADVVDKGIEEVTFNNVKKEQHSIVLVFQLEELMDNGKPFAVTRKFNATLHERGALRKFLVAMRGKNFSPDELKEFDLEGLIGQNVSLNIVHNETPRGTFANIAGVSPWNPKHGENLEVRDYVRVQDRAQEDTEYTPEDDGKF